MLNLLVFKKGYESVNEKGKKISYDRYFTSEPDGSFKMSATLTNAFKEKLNSLDVKFPILVDLDETKHDYFFVKDTFDNETGEVDSIYKIVINDAQTISNGEVKQVTYEEAKKFNMDRKNK